MHWDGALVRFGELGIKSAPVRRRMLERLRQNLLDAMVRFGVEGDAEKRGARLWLVGPDVDALADVARHVFGVVSVSPVRLVEPDLEALSAAAAELALTREWSSFAIRARREGEHGFSSQDVGRVVGSAVWREKEGAGGSPSVDLDDPDLELFVEVRGPRAYVFLDTLPGPGGLPLGSQGRVVALLSDEASFVAAWLMMRRGCSVVPVHAGDQGSLPAEAVEALARWGLPEEVELLPVCSGVTTKGALLEAASRIAEDVGASAVVTGDRLDSRLSPSPLPVLRPVCGLHGAEFERWRAACGVPDVDADGVLGDDGDDADALLSMRRRVAL